MRPSLVVIVATLCAACATNPVTGKRELSLLSEADELALGRQADAEIRREMGVYDDTEVQRYVSDIGMRLARVSHRPNLPWTFTVVDNSAINAFAVPGGYVYITRGILPYLADESELAGVLGHEIGHVTARHAAQQYTRQAGGGLGLAILSIFVPQTAPFADLSSMGLGFLFLKYGRDDELQSDRLGMEYAAEAGWDPGAVPRFLTTLARVDEMSERGVPNWLSTHPEPASRVGDAEAVVATFVSDTARRRNADEFLRTIDGVVVGDSLEQGIVRDNVFLHPMMRIGLEFPEGWDVFNSPEQVTAREPGQPHYMLLQQVDQPRGTGLEDVAQNAMRSAGFTRVDGAPERLGGADAYVGLPRFDSRHGPSADAGCARVDRPPGLRRRGIRAGSRVRAREPVHPGLARTFRELSASEAAQVRPNRLTYYTVRAGDSWQSIAQRAGQGITSAATLAIMNGYEVSTQPQEGERIKIVVEG
ncbi:MAG: M48 family metalloprotease [Vicinamibacterales bacterium]